jgi:hypothetical protein
MRADLSREGFRRTVGPAPCVPRAAGGPERRGDRRRLATTIAPCAKSFEDISALTQAYQEGDAAPEQLASGRIVWLAQGTSVKPFDIDKDVTTVLVAIRR